MPELPELEVIREVLQARITCQRVLEVEVRRPLVLRDLTGEGFENGLTGRAVSAIARRGKFLLCLLGEPLPDGAGGARCGGSRSGGPAPISDPDRPLLGDRTLAINPMLSGRLQLCSPETRCLPYTQVILRLSEGQELRYADRRTMGKLYLTEDLERIPGWAEMGPDALDPQLTLERFGERLRRHRGEIKGILSNARFVAGIGNAYADEICFHACLYPFRKRPSLSGDEVTRLYSAMRSTLTEAIAQTRRTMGTDIHTKPREFLAVHGRGGQPCPRCGAPISQISARKRLTNFCRRCQPGSLITL